MKNILELTHLLFYAHFVEQDDEFVFHVAYFKTLPDMQVLNMFSCFPIQQPSGGKAISAVRREQPSFCERGLPYVWHLLPHQSEIQP